MIKYKGGNGSSKEQAIIILGADNEFEGVDAECDYLESKYGEHEIESQVFIGEADKKYDVLNIKFSDENKKELWFDITDFYGKEDE